jgi:hypothetical protein
MHLIRHFQAGTEGCASAVRYAQYLPKQAVPLVAQQVRGCLQRIVKPPACRAAGIQLIRNSLEVAHPVVQIASDWSASSPEHLVMRERKLLGILIMAGA